MSTRETRLQELAAPDHALGRTVVPGWLISDETSVAGALGMGLPLRPKSRDFKLLFAPDYESEIYMRRILFLPEDSRIELTPDGPQSTLNVTPDGMLGFKANTVELEEFVDEIETRRALTNKQA
jgi:hypothetical protein